MNTRKVMNMNKAISKISMVIGTVLFVLASGGNATVLAGEQGPKIFKVKGLYLGMNIDEGHKIIKEFITPALAATLGEGKPLEITQIPPFEKCKYGLGYFPPGCPQILLQSDCSEDKKVDHIFIQRDIANEMFDAKRLAPEEFVQLFETAYYITMKPEEEQILSDPSSIKLWEFESLHGYKVIINSDHTIIIEPVVR